MKKVILGLAALVAVMTLGTTSLVAHDHAKCGASKCGTSKPAKCGGETPTAKCGGDKNASSGKCATAKCGGK